MNKYYLRVFGTNMSEDIVIEADRLDSYENRFDFIVFTESGQARLSCSYPVYRTIIVDIDYFKKK